MEFIHKRLMNSVAALRMEGRPKHKCGRSLWAGLSRSNAVMPAHGTWRLCWRGRWRRTSDCDAGGQLQGVWRKLLQSHEFAR